MDTLKNRYPHISFTKQWVLTPEIYFMLGECSSLIKAITNTAIRPDYLKTLHQVALIKGAQATTAIEGNTLTVEEIQRIQEGKKLPPSKAYLQVEVENVIEALNGILDDVVLEHKIHYISKELIQNFHLLVGKNLGDHFEAVPGKFRNNNVGVGTYKAPDFKDVNQLIDALCEWLKREFTFGLDQTFIDAVVQAIVTHVYIAWIHPFSDGNGRTARLLEFYILLRAGVPDIASHVLSNFYNITRSEYYRQLENANRKKDLTQFILYAVQGFRDGLNEVLETVQENQLLITWRNYIYGIFDKKITVGKTKKANKRRRNLLLEIPYDRYLSMDDIFSLKPWIVKEYAELSERSLARDIDELITLGLLEKKNKKYRAPVEQLRKFMAVKSGE